MSNPMIAFTLDPVAVIQLVTAVLLPILVGLVTNRATSGAVKAWTLAGLALVSSLLTEMGNAWAAGEAYDLGVGLVGAIPVFAIAVATHYGLWKPTGVAYAAQDVRATSIVDRRDRQRLRAEQDDTTEE